MKAGPDALTARFDALVAEHERDVLAVCRSLLRDDHLGADAAQDAFVKLWTRVSSGRAPERVGGWLRRAAISSALDLLRRRTVREDAARGADVREVDERAPSDALADAELAAAYERGLAGLSEGQRTIFLLRHEGGLPLREVADALSVAPSTVKTQFARACLRLQAALHRHDPRETR